MPMGTLRRMEHASCAIAAARPAKEVQTTASFVMSLTSYKETDVSPIVMSVSTDTPIPENATSVQRIVQIAEMVIPMIPVLAARKDCSCVIIDVYPRVEISRQNICQYDSWVVPTLMKDELR